MLRHRACIIKSTVASCDEAAVRRESHTIHLPLRGHKTFSPVCAQMKCIRPSSSPAAMTSPSGPYCTQRISASKRAVPQPHAPCRKTRSTTSALLSNKVRRPAQRTTHAPGTAACRAAGHGTACRAAGHGGCMPCSRAQRNGHAHGVMWLGCGAPAAPFCARGGRKGAVVRAEGGRLRAQG